jgi:glycosyltransferase involved in cell wall biosynthesis
VHYFLLFFLVLFPLSAEEKPTICLNMIVKNEAHVITRCLASVKPIIDYWVIVDTGSTDGTQEVIKECMKDVPGELFERPWKNFEHNRNEALELARTKADYLLIMDADDELSFQPHFKLPLLDSGSYRIWIDYSGLSYQRDQLISMKLPWKWFGVLHEYLSCDQPHTCTVLDGVRYLVHPEGARSRDPQKYRKDAAVLEEALKEDPTNTRYMFYLAQSYRDLGEYEKAIEWYEKRIACGEWEEEIFWSTLQVAICQQILQKPTHVVINSFLKAYRLQPFRSEPVFYLATLYRSQGRYDLAYALIKLREHLPRKPKNEMLFFSSWCEEYGLLCELSANAYLTGHYQECLDASNKLLAMDDLPESLREQARINRQSALDKIQATSESHRPESSLPTPSDSIDHVRQNKDNRRFSCGIDEITSVSSSKAS